MDQVECIVVGAGVAGLAVARRLAVAGVEVVVLEAAEMIGTETSSRNSEVIHAGIYYAKDSLKARLCVTGKRQLYRYCAERGVPHRNCGKLIVATSDEEVGVLAEIQARAEANGVEDVYLVDGAEARAMEPELNATAGLVSPSTGIIDSHGLMLAYQGEAEEHGAMLAFLSPLLDARVSEQGFELRVGDAAGSETRVGCRLLVNAAGLSAQAVAQAIDGLDPKTVPPGYLCKGNYFSLTGRQPFGHLIYPVPASAGLGVHVTLDMAGQARFGPDQEWIDEVDYDVDPGRAEVFYDAIRRYWPALPDGSLQPSYCGIRPKLQAPGGPVADFMVQGPEAHGVPGLVNLYGIESPGLTASPALADMVARLLAVGAASA